MSALITTNLATYSGKFGDTSTTDLVDITGTLKTSPQFLTNFAVDYTGNIGALSVLDCTLLASIIGSAIAPGPWEVQVGTTETIGSNNSTNTNNYVAPFSIFVAANTTGYMSGVLSGTSPVTIQGGTQSIGGTAYSGGGIIVTHGNNTITGVTTVQSGANLQVGLDETNTTTKLGTLTTQADSNSTIFGAYTTNTFATQGLNNVGTVNFIGPGICGQGMMIASTVVNSGVINIDKASWRNQSTWSGTGTVNVKNGGTFVLSSIPIGSTTRINLNGDGWCNASGVKIGALNCTATGITYSARVNVQSASTIKLNTNMNVDFSGILSGSAPLKITTLGTPVNGIIHLLNTANTYFGTITVDGTTLNASYGTALQYAKIVLANGGRLGTNANSGATIASLASNSSASYWQSGDPVNNTIANNGITTYAGRLLWIGGQYAANYFLNGPATNELTMTGTGNTGNIYPRTGARLILQGATFTAPGGQVRAATGATVSAGTSITAACTYLSLDTTSKLEVRAVGASCGLLKVGSLGLVLTAGWKVDLPDAMAPGTYEILHNSGASSTVLPTTGVNNTGRTVSYAWQNGALPRKLILTLI